MKSDKLVNFLIFFIISIILINLIKKIGELDKQNIAITGGVIKNCIIATKGTAKFIDAEFFINDKKYKSTAGVVCSKLRIKELEKRLVGKVAVVVYQIDNPNKNELLLSKHRYDYYGIPINDSLKWIDSLVNCY